MAQYEHLPIYKKAYDLTVYFEKVVRNFSRYHKYTLGSELRELSREVLRLIRRANDSAEKTPLLLQNREKLEDLKIVVRLWLSTAFLAKDAGGIKKAARAGGGCARNRPRTV